MNIIKTTVSREPYGASATLMIHPTVGWVYPFLSHADAVEFTTNIANIRRISKLYYFRRISALSQDRAALARRNSANLGEVAKLYVDHVREQFKDGILKYTPLNFRVQSSTEAFGAPYGVSSAPRTAAGAVYRGPGKVYAYPDPLSAFDIARRALAKAEHNEALRASEYRLKISDLTERLGKAKENAALLESKLIASERHNEQRDRVIKELNNDLAKVKPVAVARQHKSEAHEYAVIYGIHLYRFYTEGAALTAANKINTGRASADSYIKNLNPSYKQEDYA